MSETVTLLAYRERPDVAVRFLDAVKPALLLVPTTLAILEAAARVFRQRARTQAVSFCDAISYVVVTEVLGGAPCLSFDRDFQALGLTVIR